MIRLTAGYPSRDLPTGTGDSWLQVASGEASMACDLDAERLSIRACPETKAPVVAAGCGFSPSIDPAARRRYRVRDAIPVLPIDRPEGVAESEVQPRVAEDPAMDESPGRKNVKLRNEPIWAPSSP